MAKQRIALWDNARLILITLVVVGHMLTTIRTDGTLPFGLYTLIYLFHMPAMILLAGVFSRADGSPKTMRGIAGLAVTWVLWEVIWVGLRGLLGRGIISSTFLVNASWSLWFILSLVTMKIVLPYIARFKYPVTLSIVIAVLAGFNPAIGTEFSAARTLAFLPFFVIGWAAKDRGWITRARFLAPTAAKKLTAWAVLAVTLAALLIPGLKAFWRVDKWILRNKPYAEVLEGAPIGAPGGPPLLSHEQGWPALLVAMALIFVLSALALLLTWALLVVAPRAETRFTVWGQRTMYVYLLHGPVIQALRQYGFIDAVGQWGVAGVFVLIALGIALTAALSTAAVTRATKAIVEPRTDWLRREPARREPARS